MSVLVTGAAGFIGYHVSSQLLARGERVVGVDDFDDFSGAALKRARRAQLDDERFAFVEGDIADPDVVAGVFAAGIDRVVHLAAKVGVRRSMERPEPFLRTNLGGFGNVIEAARRAGVRHFVYASSSSVYGASTALPFRETDRTDRPLSVYAATKSANELIARSYSEGFGLPTSGLRFFTAYGPWGRPDMALGLFSGAILRGEPIRLFGAGMQRDFTYIDDVVRAVVAVLDVPPASSRVLNVGADEPVAIERLIALLEAAYGMPATIELAPHADGDLPRTWADLTLLREVIGDFLPTPIEVGVARYAAWFRAHGLAY